MVNKHGDIIDIHDLKNAVQGTAERVAALLRHRVFKEDGNFDANAMKANIMLAYRHLEDAEMRLGKVIEIYTA